MSRVRAEILPAVFLIKPNGSAVRRPDVEPSPFDAQVGVKATNVLVESLAQAAASGFGHEVVQVHVADVGASPRQSHFELTDDFGFPPQMNAASRQFPHPVVEPVDVSLLTRILLVEHLGATGPANIRINAELHAQISVFSEINELEFKRLIAHRERPSQLNPESQPHFPIDLDFVGEHSPILLDDLAGSEIVLVAGDEGLADSQGPNARKDTFENLRAVPLALLSSTVGFIVVG
jgi:hypothetical protein